MNYATKFELDVTYDVGTKNNLMSLRRYHYYPSLGSCVYDWEGFDLSYSNLWDALKGNCFTSPQTKAAITGVCHESFSQSDWVVFSDLVTYFVTYQSSVQYAGHSWLSLKGMWLPNDLGLDHQSIKGQFGVCGSADDPIKTSRMASLLALAVQGATPPPQSQTNWPGLFSKSKKTIITASDDDDDADGGEPDLLNIIPTF